MGLKFSDVRKFFVAFAGVIAQIIAANVLDDRIQSWAVAVLALLTAVGVYEVPNTNSKETE